MHWRLSLHIGHRLTIARLRQIDFLNDFEDLLPPILQDRLLANPVGALLALLQARRVRASAILAVLFFLFFKVKFSKLVSFATSCRDDLVEILRTSVLLVKSMSKKVFSLLSHLSAELQRALPPI